MQLVPLASMKESLRLVRAAQDRIVRLLEASATGSEAGLADAICAEILANIRFIEDVRAARSHIARRSAVAL